MVAIVTNGTQLVNKARAASEWNITRIVVEAEEITIPDMVAMPKKLKCSGKQLEIDLQGCTVKAGKAMEFMFGRVAPVDNVEAVNTYQSQGFHIHNGLLDGKGLAQYGILNRSSYHNLTERVTVISTPGGGIVEEFGMNCIIRQCETRNILGYGFALLPGSWSGAGLNSSGSNNSEVNHCRSFPKQDQAACFVSKHSGSTRFIANIVDAAKDQLPQRGFLIDNSGSTTCKNVTIDGLWAESLTSVAMIDANLSGGYLIVSGMYPQYGGVMIRAEGTNYSEVHAGLFGNVPSNARFHAVDADTVWKFSDNPVSYDFTNPVNWIGGVLPGKYFVEGFIYNKEYAFKSVGAVKLNGKNLLTQA